MLEEREERHEVVPDQPALTSLHDAVSAEVAGQMMMRRDYFFGHFFTS